MKGKIKTIVKEIWRAPYKHILRIRLKNRSFRVVSSNCIGGCLLHDLGMPFLTPTINMTITPFGKFISDLKIYLETVPVLIGENESYPVIALDDIIIHAVHYNNFACFNEAWARRIQRFRKSDAEIVIIATDAQVRTEEDIEAFLSAPYRNLKCALQISIDRKRNSFIFLVLMNYHVWEIYLLIQAYLVPGFLRSISISQTG